MHPDDSKQKPFNRSTEVRLRDAVTTAAGTRPFRCRAEHWLGLSFHDPLLPLSIGPAYRTLKTNTSPFGISHLEGASQEVLEFTILFEHHSRRLLRPTSHGAPSKCHLTTLNSIPPFRNLPSANTKHFTARVTGSQVIPRTSRARTESVVEPSLSTTSSDREFQQR